LNSEKILKIWRKGKLNSEMIWKIWKISVLVIITPKQTTSLWSFKTFVFPYFFPVLFQTATFEIQRLNYQLVEEEEEEGGWEEVE
jgi:hypothetical protein